MGTPERRRTSRSALIAVAILAVVVATILRPTWPQDVWFAATTKEVPFEFASLGVCEERDPYQPDTMALSSDRRSIQVFASLNCADTPGHPSVSQRANTLFLRTRPVPIDPDAGLAASCYCSNKITFALRSPVRPGQHVIFFSGNSEEARLIVPK